MEVSGYLVGSTAFKAAETSDPRLAGSIPVHLREIEPWSACAVTYGDVRPGFDVVRLLAGALRVVLTNSLL
jgi:hypothetical protein